MDPVPTHYIDRDGAALAYQVVGEGPVDVVNLVEMVMHPDLCWTDPDLHHIYERGAAYSRTVFFQRRGFGLSDRITYTPTLEQQADDVLAVMDAVGMSRATLVGTLGTCGALALVAANVPGAGERPRPGQPDLAGGGLRTGDPTGWTGPEIIRYRDGYEHAFTNWGSGEVIDMWDPVQATAFNRRLMALLERSSATPAAAKAYYDWILKIDIQDVLRSVQVPTRVLRPSVEHRSRGCRSRTWRSSSPTGLSTSFPRPCQARPSARRSCRSPTTSRRWRPARSIPPMTTGSSGPCCSPTSSPPPSCCRAWGTRSIATCGRPTSDWSGWLSRTAAASSSRSWGTAR